MTEDLRKLAEKHLDNIHRVVARRFTPDGEIYIYKHQGIETEAPLAMPPWPEDQEHKLDAKQFDAMHIIYTAVEQIKDKGRLVPMLRSEAFGFGIEKPTLAYLVKRELVGERVIPLKRNTDQKNIGSRAVIYFTPAGRSLVKKYIDPKYGEPRDGSNEGRKEDGKADSSGECDGLAPEDSGTVQ
jgi:hypothetical protein